MQQLALLLRLWGSVYLRVVAQGGPAHHEFHALMYDMLRQCMTAFCRRSRFRRRSMLALNHAWARQQGGERWRRGAASRRAVLDS